MKKLIITFLLLFGVCSFTSAETLESPVISKDSTVRLWSPVEGNSVASCNGVVVNKTEKYTYVLTAKHCLPEDYKGTMVDVDYDAVDYTKHQTRDLALLRVFGVLKNKNTAVIAKTTLRIYEKVYKFSYRRKGQSLDKGKVTLFMGGKVYSNVSAIKGDSGSGIFNYRGELVGIFVTAKKKSSGHMSLETIKKFLENNKSFLEV